LILVFASIFLNSVAQVLIKYVSLNTDVNSLSSVLRKPHFYATGFTYFLSIVLWFLALRTIKLSIAFPLQSLGYVIVTFASYLVFSEKIGKFQVLGLIFILLGAYFVSRSK
jgi:drug/metabolite transporter (DMT)-like permease